MFTYTCMLSHLPLSRTGALLGYWTSGEALSHLRADPIIITNADGATETSSVQKEVTAADGRDEAWSQVTEVYKFVGSSRGDPYTVSLLPSEHPTMLLCNPYAPPFPVLPLPLILLRDEQSFRYDIDVSFPSPVPLSPFSAHPHIHSPIDPEYDVSLFLPQSVRPSAPPSLSPSLHHPLHSHASSHAA